MNVNELNYEEMLQLKEDLYYGVDILPELTEEQHAEVNEAMSTDDISDELIHEVYGGYNFVKEDFWCNCKHDED